MMANMHMKRCSSSLVMSKKLIRYYLTPTRMSTIKKADNVGTNVEELELSYAVNGNVKSYNHFAEFGSFLKI